MKRPAVLEDAGHAVDGTERLVWALACIIMVSIPFLVVQYAPLADLPQQAAQIRLFLEALDDPSGPYRILWFSPNRLSYLVLGGCWAVFPPQAVGRMAMLAIGILWIASTHYLAHRRRRPVVVAALASILFFNHVVYWGFYSFAIGWPVFVIWQLLLSSSGRSGKTEGMAVGLTAFLLYEAHALWFVAGLLWLGIRHIWVRDRLGVTLLRLGYTAPTVIVAAIWYPQLSQAGFTSETFLVTTVWQRLTSPWLFESAFGGLRGWLEPAGFAVLFGWLVLAAVGYRKTPRPAFDRELLASGVLLTSLALFLPYLYSGTIQFAERWFPVALTLLVLGAPVPRLPAWIQRTVAAGSIFTFCLVTTLSWRAVESREYSGLTEAIEALPLEPRVLGLDFMKRSSILRVRRPFLQTFAYSQVIKGGQVGFSFAEHASSLVVYKRGHQRPWTEELERYPERVKRSDIGHFTHLMISGEEGIHDFFSEYGLTEAVTHTGLWRLYRVKKNLVLTETTPSRWYAFLGVFGEH